MVWPPRKPFPVRISHTRLPGMSPSTSSRPQISALYGSSLEPGVGRSYAGGSALLTAARTVLRASPICLAIDLMPCPCAWRRRISAHSCTSIMSLPLVEQCPTRLTAPGPEVPEAWPKGGQNSNVVEGSRFKRRRQLGSLVLQRKRRTNVVQNPPSKDINI